MAMRLAEADILASGQFGLCSLRLAVGSLTGAADSRFVVGRQAPDVAAGAIPVRHGRPAQLAIDARGLGFAFAGLLAQAGWANQLVTLGHGRRGLQMQLYLTFHANPGQVTLGEAPLVTDAAPASRERCSPAHQPDFMFRAAHGTFHALILAFSVRLVKSLRTDRRSSPTARLRTATALPGDSSVDPNAHSIEFCASFPYASKGNPLPPPKS